MGQEHRGKRKVVRLVALLAVGGTALSDCSIQRPKEGLLQPATAVSAEVAWFLRRIQHLPFKTGNIKSE